MLNDKKIRLMTKLARFEDCDGKEELKIDRYYRVDYIRYQVLKSVLCVTLGYILVILSILVYQSEYVMDNITAINYRKIGFYMVTVYLFILLFYSFITGIISYFHYERAKTKLKKYKKNLKTLRILYKEGSESE